MEEILKAFKLFDEDNTGRISLRNLRRVARELGENLSDDELQAMIDEFDKDGDGEICENEFLGIMKQTSIYWRCQINCSLTFSIRNMLEVLHVQIQIIPQASL